MDDDHELLGPIGLSHSRGGRLMCKALNDNGHCDDGGYSPYNINKCPLCGSTSVAAEVKTWADFIGGRPDHFDDEDIANVDIVDGGEAICRSCGHPWVIAPMEGR